MGLQVSEDVNFVSYICIYMTCESIIHKIFLFIVVLHLKGRFWHQRPTVLQRVGAYLMGRIPEIVDVIVEDEYELTDEANDAAILD